MLTDRQWSECKTVYRGHGIIAHILYQFITDIYMYTYICGPVYAFFSWSECQESWRCA